MPNNVEVMFRDRNMKPIVPMPPKSPFCGNNLQGPSSKKLAIPLAAEISEVKNVAMNKYMLCPSINLFCCPQRLSKMCTCSTLSNRGSEK